MKRKLFALAGVFTLGTGAFTAQASAAELTYTVQKGDTLWDISQQHNISVQDLQTWNELNSSLIFPQQVLKVTPAEQQYTVVQGDTLFDIAMHFGVCLDDLMQWNDLTSDLIHPGDQLILKGASEVQVPQQTAAPKQEAAPQQAAQESPAPQQTAAPQQQESEPVQQAPAPQAPAETQTPSATTEAPAPSSNGEKEMVVKATAYSEDCDGCSGVTATGLDLRSNPDAKVIAVDPSVIPLGTKVWVEGYGEAIAADTGGAIKGNRIDVFISDDQQAAEWGVRDVKIKILD